MSFYNYTTIPTDWLIGEWLLDWTAIDSSWNWNDWTATDITWVDAERGYVRQCASFDWWDWHYIDLWWHIPWDSNTYTVWWARRIARTIGRMPRYNKANNWGKKACLF